MLMRKHSFQNSWGYSRFVGKGYAVWLDLAFILLSRLQSVDAEVPHRWALILCLPVLLSKQGLWLHFCLPNFPLFFIYEVVFYLSSYRGIN